MPKHQTIDVEIIDGRMVPIDCGVVPLVVALNKLAGVVTIESCEGEDSFMDGHAYVRFVITNDEDDTDDLLASDSHVCKVLDHISLAIYRNRPNNSARVALEFAPSRACKACILTCSGQEVIRIARVIDRLAWPR